MSRLEIAELSFFETELENSVQIKGGMSFEERLSSLSFGNFPRRLISIPVLDSDIEVLEESEGKDGEKIRRFRVGETGGFGVEISKENGSGTMLSRVRTGGNLGVSLLSGSF